MAEKKTLCLKELKNVSIGHGCPHFQLKQACTFRQIKGHNSITEKVEKSEIKLSSLFMVSDLVYISQMIFLWETQVIELKLKVGHKDRWMGTHE